MDPLIINRDETILYPLWRDLLTRAIAVCQKAGHHVYLFEGLRTYQRSDYLFTQGRTRPGAIVTKARAGESSHNFAIAGDLVFDGDIIKPGMQWTWNGNYAKVAQIIKNTSPLIEWAGDWKTFQEMPHFQLKQPFSMSQLNKFYQTGGLELVFAELDKVLKGSYRVFPLDQGP